MTLIELLRDDDIAEDDEATIYVVRPWSPIAEAILVRPAPAAIEPVERNGGLFEYFLEGFLAREFLEDLAESGDFEGVSEEELCERLIRYAETDA